MLLLFYFILLFVWCLADFSAIGSISFAPPPAFHVRIAKLASFDSETTLVVETNIQDVGPIEDEVSERFSAIFFGLVWFYISATRCAAQVYARMCKS